MLDERVDEDPDLGRKAAVAGAEGVDVEAVAFGVRKEAHEGAARHVVAREEVRQASDAETATQRALSSRVC